jgi:hypothetical protein
MYAWEDEVSSLGTTDRLRGFNPGSKSWEDKLVLHFPDVTMWDFDVCCGHLGGFILVQQRVMWIIHGEN